MLLVTEHAAPSPWIIVIDQDLVEAYAGVESLKTLITAIGVVFILIAMGSLIFILRSFTDRKSTRLNSSHSRASRMPSSA